MDDNYFGNVEQKSRGFYIALGIMAAAFLLSMNTDLQFLSQRKEMQIPDEFLWIVFTVDILALLMIVLMAFFRKAGVILYPFVVILHFLLHHFYLSNIIYADINALFFYFVAGLFVVIPRWKYFK